MKPTSRHERLGFSSVLLVIASFCVLVLLFTALGMALAPTEAQVGGVRPADTIPLHLAALAGFGALLGGGAAMFYGRRGLPMVLLVPALTVLLDLDHLPAYLGFIQPIRPAHSVIFLVAAVALAAIEIRRLDVALVVLSAIVGHLGIDTGLFPLLAPVSYDYFQFDPYRVWLLGGAALVAIIAGVIVRREGTRAKEGNSTA